MQDGTATELEGVKAIDDKTLEVTLDYGYGDFEYVVGHPSLGPVPKEEVDKDPAAFPDMPIGNGPFMMAAPWQHDQLHPGGPVRRLRRQDGPLRRRRLQDLQGQDTAFLEFKAGNLDFTQIPSGQVEATKAEFGASADGYTIEPGKQVLSGSRDLHLLHGLQHDGRAAEERRPAQGHLAGHQPPGHLRHGL